MKIWETGENYSKMLYKEALRTGFYELQTAKDKYLQLSPVVNLDLIKKYIEIQIILLSPICPHVCEYIWGDLLKKVSFSSTNIYGLLGYLYRNIID